MSNDPNGAPPSIPPSALSGMESWAATVIWAPGRGRVTWRLSNINGEIRYLKVLELGREPSLAAERDRMAWAASRLPVPTLLTYGADAEHEWLLTVGLAGVNAIDDGWLADPRRLVHLFAEGLRQFHSLPVANCPFDSRMAGALDLARRRITTGLVDIGRDLSRDHGPLTAAAALSRLAELCPPDEDLVVCHGGYCLPNVLLDNDRISGFVDLGKLGVADRWWDLAVATWSVTWNLGPGWEDLFLEAYGIPRDNRKIAFYRLLFDLLP